MSPDELRRATHRELVEEAERRGISRAEWMDRDALLRSLADERDGSARARGSRTERADDHKLTPFARARRFLGRVTGLGRVVDTVRTTVEPPRPRDVSLAGREPLGEAQTPARLEEPRQSVSDPLLADPSFGGLRSVTRGGRTWLVWRADPTRLSANGGEAAELTLRTVSIGCAFGELDADVVVKTEDVAGVSREGARALTLPSASSLVAAIGLGAGPDFVALAHTRVM